MNQLQAVFADLDGSLLRTDGCIHPRDLQTIHGLKDRGIPVFIVTGRHAEFCGRYAVEMGIDLPAVCCNGGNVFDFAARRSLYSFPIARGLAERVLLFLEESQSSYYIYAQHHAYFTPDNPRLSFYRQYALTCPAGYVPALKLTDAFSFDEDQVLKFVLRDAARDFYDALCVQFALDGLELCYTEHHFLEMNAPGVNKGYGAAYLAKRYGFPLENALALGNDHNDIPMLRQAGYAAVPAGSEAVVEQHADYLCSRCDDAPLTDSIRHFFPGLLP